LGTEAIAPYPHSFNYSPTNNLDFPTDHLEVQA
jgi:hypothetical protein